MFTNQTAIYDGALGTMIQNYYSKRNTLDEAPAVEYHGDRFVDFSCNVKGNNGMDDET